MISIAFIVLFIICLYYLIYFTVFTHKDSTSYICFFKVILSSLLILICISNFMLNNTIKLISFVIIIFLTSSLFNDISITINSSYNNSTNQYICKNRSIYLLINLVIRLVLFSLYSYIGTFSYEVILISLLFSIIFTLILVLIDYEPIKKSLPIITVYSFISFTVILSAFSLIYADSYVPSFSILSIIGCCLLSLSDLFLLYIYTSKHSFTTLTILQIVIYYIAQSLLSLCFI